MSARKTVTLRTHPKVTTAATLPFPAPRLPRTTSLTPGITDGLLEEAFVVAHHELAVDLTHRLEGDADRYQQGGPVEGEPVEVPQRHEERRHDGDRAQEQRAHHRDAAEDVGEVA